MPREPVWTGWESGKLLPLLHWRPQPFWAGNYRPCPPLQPQLALRFRTVHVVRRQVLLVRGEDEQTTTTRTTTTTSRTTTTTTTTTQGHRTEVKVTNRISRSTNRNLKDNELKSRRHGNRGTSRELKGSRPQDLKTSTDYELNSSSS